MKIIACLYFILATGCVSYRSVGVTPQGVTNTVSYIQFGGGNRTLAISKDSIRAVHTQIPETISNFGTLAGNAASAAIKP